MKKITQIAARLAACVAVCIATIHPGIAQGLAASNIGDPGDPVRWYQEDLTPRARFLTSKKENYAAYKDALIECKQVESSARSACIRDARHQLNQDQESAKKALQESSH